VLGATLARLGASWPRVTWIWIMLAPLKLGRTWTLLT